MTSDAAKSQDPVKRRHLRKIAQRARREFEAGQAGLLKGKAFVGSLDVKTACDVAKPSVVSKILTLTGVHGWPAPLNVQECGPVQKYPQTCN